MKAQTIALETRISELPGLACTTEWGVGRAEGEAKRRRENLDCRV
jgi:hypothetical protein